MNINCYEHFYKLNGQLFYELYQLKEMVLQCQSMISILNNQVYTLSQQNDMLQQAIEKMQRPVNIENLHISHDVNVDQVKVNSIQSGAALNIGERILSTTKSDMQMEMGPNSYNSGDCNEMQYYDDSLLDDKHV